MAGWRGSDFLERHAQKNLMSELEATNEAEVEDFTDELSDDDLHMIGAPVRRIRASGKCPEI